MLLRVVLALGIGASALAQTLPKRQLVEELRLDATAEDFPDIWQVLAGPRGEIVVLVAKDQQLRFYDASGRKTGTLGRVGSGPGEFRRANWSGWTADTLWLYDVDLRRMTFITPGRQLLRSEVFSSSLNTAMNPDGPGGVGTVVQYTPRAVTNASYVGNAVISAGMTSEGRLIPRVRIMAIPRGASNPAGRGGYLAGASDTIGGGARSFIGDPPSPTTNFMTWTAPDGGGTAAANVPFTFTALTVFSPDGGRFGYLTVEPNETGGTYTLKIMKITGEQVFAKSYPYTGIPIPRHVADSAIEHIGLTQEGRPLFQPEAATKLRAEARARMPKFYSPVGTLHINRDSTAWLQMRRPSAQAPAPVILIDDRGNQIATFDLPPRTRIAAATRDQIWTIVTDDDDLPSVVRYRIK